MQPKRPRRVVRRLVLLVVIVLVAVVGWWLYSHRSRTITVTYAEGVSATVEIYKATEMDEHGHFHGHSEDVLETLTESGEIELRPGAYAAVIEESENFEPFYESFEVGGESGVSEITIAPALNEAALARILVEEEVSITSAVDQHFSGQNRYEITGMSIHGRGQWASVVMNIDNLLDYFHVVLGKEGGQWSVLTKPAIILSVPEYPNIPREVLIEVNQKQFEGTGFRQ